MEPSTVWTGERLVFFKSTLYQFSEKNPKTASFKRKFTGCRLLSSFEVLDEFHHARMPHFKTWMGVSPTVWRSKLCWLAFCGFWKFISVSLVQEWMLSPPHKNLFCGFQQSKEQKELFRLLKTDTIFSLKAKRSRLSLLFSRQTSNKLSYWLTCGYFFCILLCFNRTSILHVQRSKQWIPMFHVCW